MLASLTVPHPTLAQGTPPPAPTLTAAAGSGQVTLSWNQTVTPGTNQDVVYWVYRGTAPGGEGSSYYTALYPPYGSKTAPTTYTDTAVTNGTAYYYEVVTVLRTQSGSAEGLNESAPSNEASATPHNPSQPPVTDLAAYATGSGKITLYWSGVNGATGYNVYRGTASGGENYSTPVNGATPVTTQDTGPGVSNIYQFSDTGLTDGTEYFYTVVAVYAAGVSAASNEDSDVPDPAAVPWDGSSPSAILSAFRSAFASDVENVGTGSYVLRVVGPDNVIYDDSYSTAQPTDGTITSGTNQFVRPDGSSLSLPDDLGEFDTPSGMGPNSVGTSLPASRGPYRRVRTGPTALYRGESGMVVLPSPQITPTGHTHGDTAMIFLGASGANIEVDTGLQYSTTYGDWEVFMNINGRYVGTGNNPIPPTHLLNIPANFIHVPSGDVPTVSYWAWGRLPSQNRAKLSLLLVDDSLYGGDGRCAGSALEVLREDRERARQACPRDRSDGKRLRCVPDWLTDGRCLMEPGVRDTARQCRFITGVEYRRRDSN